MVLEDFKQMFEEGKRKLNNKTLIYLSPCLQHYGEEFMSLFYELSHTGMFMNDLHWRIAKNDHGRYYLFLIINAKASKTFIQTLDNLKTTDVYVADYPFGELFGGMLHSIVLKIPETYHGAYDIMMKYIEGETVTVPYSKMYTEEQIDKLFVSLYGKTSRAVKVLKKDPEYRKIFENYLNKLAIYAEDYRGNEHISLIELDENSELEYLPNPHEEILNL